jgi:hypothetical protein
LRLKDLSQRFLAGLGRQVRIQPVDGVPQLADENNVAVGGPLACHLARGNLVAMQGRVTEIGKQAEGGGLDVGLI